MKPCSNTACPFDGRVQKDGELCEDCKRRDKELEEFTFQFFTPKHDPSKWIRKNKKKGHKDEQ